MMPFKTILIHAGGERRFQSQLAVGFNLATRFQAHVVGLAITPASIKLPAGVSEIVTVDDHRKAFCEQATRMKAAFERNVAGLALGAEWITADADHSSAEAVLADQAHAADLVVTGQIDAGTRGAHGSNLIERLILTSGRPVLVAPRASGYQSPLGGRVLIAWNGEREATRAAFDALPILKLAQHVKVLCIGVGKGDHGQKAQFPEQLCRIFARHDVQARPEVIALPGAHVGIALLSAIKAEGADLLVMGCCGHVRHFEYVLGGTSRFVLQEAPIPVLMSH